jgi:broad specificity phosphatase PhoE
MGRLYFVRHAQASFFEPNYDKLSATGEAQARLLGEYWARRNVIFRRACSGPGVRHRDTTRIVREAYAKIGLDFPAPIVLDELDEFHGEAVLEKSIPRLLKSNPVIRELHGALQLASAPDERARRFQKLFEAVITMWVNEELVLDEVESWQEFSARVNRGISKVLSAACKGENVVIFSSGGPIAVSVQRALHLSAPDTLKVAWMLRNCSYSEFLFSGDRFTLSTFNSYPHLEDAALLTYR